MHQVHLKTCIQAFILLALTAHFGHASNTWCAPHTQDRSWRAESAFGVDVVVFTRRHPFVLPLRQRGSIALVTSTLPYHTNEKIFDEQLKHYIEVVLPNLLHWRFDGIYLTSLPNKINKVEVTRVIKAIKYHYPEIKIMLDEDSLKNKIYGVVDLIDMVAVKQKEISLDESGKGDGYKYSIEKAYIKKQC